MQFTNFWFHGKSHPRLLDWRSRRVEGARETRKKEKEKKRKRTEKGRKGRKKNREWGKRLRGEGMKVVVPTPLPASI